MIVINQKTALLAAIVTVLAVSSIAIENGRTALAADTTTVTKNVDNTGINVQTHTNQNQQCDTAGGSSGIGGGRGFGFHGGCSASSLDTVNQTGGELRR
jgi:hypothetical protein